MGVFVESVVATSSSLFYTPDIEVIRDSYEKGSFQCKESRLGTIVQPESVCNSRRTTCCLESAAKSCLGSKAVQDPATTFPESKAEETAVRRWREHECSEECEGYRCHQNADLQTSLGCPDEGERRSGSAYSELVCHFDSEPPLPVSPREQTTSMKKRVCAEVGDEEVESNIRKKQRSGLGMAEISSAVPDSFPDGNDADDDCCLDESADELQMLCDDLCFEMSEQQLETSIHSKETSDETSGDVDNFASCSARNARRQQIKLTVGQLKEALPGGNSMETAFVLDEAIHYVKLLQLQVHTLGAKRLGGRAAR